VGADVGERRLYDGKQLTVGKSCFNCIGGYHYSECTWGHQSWTGM